MPKPLSAQTTLCQHFPCQSAEIMDRDCTHLYIIIITFLDRTGCQGKALQPSPELHTCITSANVLLESGFHLERLWEKLSQTSLHPKLTITCMAQDLGLQNDLYLLLVSVTLL